MDSETISQLGVVALEQPRTRFATSGDFTNEGDDITGLLVHYSPTHGAQDYDRNDCGVLILMEEHDLAVKIALDKGQLATAVYDALAFAQMAAPVAAPMGMGKVVRVTYKGKHEKGYKLFSVKVGLVGNDAALADWLRNEPGGLTVVQS